MHGISYHGGAQFKMQLGQILFFWVDNRINELCIYTKMHNGINLMHEGVDVLDP